MERQLTKRQYLGEGYVHIFADEKGNEVVVPCTKDEYEALALPNPTNPTLKGHTWKCSGGGTIKVDTPNTMLGEDEYCIKGEEVIIVLKDVPVDKKVQFLAKADVSTDHKFDEAKIK